MEKKEYQDFVSNMLCDRAPTNAKVHAQLIHAACGLLLEVKELEQTSIEGTRGHILCEASDVEFFLCLLDSEIHYIGDDGEATQYTNHGIGAIGTVAEQILDAVTKLVFQNREAKWAEVSELYCDFAMLWERYVHLTLRTTREELRVINVEKLVKRYRGTIFNQLLSDRRDEV
jgi:hypothetical protein